MGKRGELRRIAGNESVSLVGTRRESVLAEK